MNTERTKDKDATREKESDRLSGFYRTPNFQEACSWLLALPEKRHVTAK